MESLECRVCEAPLTDAHINRDAALVECEYCGAVFDLLQPESSPEGANPSEGAPPRTRPDTALPEKYTVEREAGRVVVSWPFTRGMVVPIAPFALFSSYISIDSLSRDGLEIVMMVPFLAIAAVCWYLILAFVFNRHRLVCDANSVIVRHGPFPLRRFQPVPAMLVDQAYVRKKSDTFTVFLQMRTGIDTPVVEDLEELDAALFIEEQIESVLDITDRAVDQERWTKTKKKKKKKKKGSMVGDSEESVEHGESA